MNKKIEEIKNTIKRVYLPKTRDWRDYERAKQLIQTGFTPDEYSLLIRFITDYLGL